MDVSSIHMSQLCHVAHTEFQGELHVSHHFPCVDSVLEYVVDMPNVYTTDSVLSSCMQYRWLPMQCIHDIHYTNFVGMGILASTASFSPHKG